MGGEGPQRRDASNTRPIETTYRQKAVDSSFGAFGWITGPSPFWKASDQHVFSDKLLVDVQWAHLGNNFTLDFHEDSLKDVQPSLETTTGVYGRSYQQSVFMRPTNSLDALANYFQPNTLGGDHAFKFGIRWRSAHSTNTNHWGGNAVARFTNGISNSVDVYRDGYSVSHLDTWAFFAQDTYTVQRATTLPGPWVTLGTVTTDAICRAMYVDTNAPGPPAPLEARRPARGRGPGAPARPHARAARTRPRLGARARPPRARGPLADTPTAPGRGHARSPPVHGAGIGRAMKVRDPWRIPTGVLTAGPRRPYKCAERSKKADRLRQPFRGRRLVWVPGASGWRCPWRRSSCSPACPPTRRPRREG